MKGLLTKFIDNTPMYFKGQKEPLSFKEAIEKLCGG